MAVWASWQRYSTQCCGYPQWNIGAWKCRGFCLFSFSVYAKTILYLICVYFTTSLWRVGKSSDYSVVAFRLLIFFNSWKPHSVSLEFEKTFDKINLRLTFNIEMKYHVLFPCWIIWVQLFCKSFQCYLVLLLCFSPRIEIFHCGLFGYRNGFIWSSHRYNFFKLPYKI